MRITYVLLLSCVHCVVLVHTMEKQEKEKEKINWRAFGENLAKIDEEESLEVKAMVNTAARVKVAKRRKWRSNSDSSKYIFDIDVPPTPSSQFTNKELRQKASSIRKSQLFLRWLDLVSNTEYADFENKLDKFELLKYLYEKFVQFTTLESPDGESSASEEVAVYKIRMYEQASLAHFLQAVHYKIKSEKKFEKVEKMVVEEKKIKGLRHAITAIERALENFLQAYNLDEENKEIIEYRNEAEVFKDSLNKMLKSMPSYKQGIQKTEEAVKYEREAVVNVLSVLTIKEKFNLFEQDERSNPPTRIRRNTLDCLKRKNKTPVEYFVHSTMAHGIVTTRKEEKKVCLSEIEKAEDACIKALKKYLEACELYPIEILIKRSKKILKRIRKLESDRLLYATIFITNPEIKPLTERLEACKKRLKAINKSSSSSDQEEGEKSV